MVLTLGMLGTSVLYHAYIKIAVAEIGYSSVSKGRLMKKTGFIEPQG
jgi:hypothetical protein